MHIESRCFSSFIENFQASNIAGLRECVKIDPTPQLASKIVGWILVNGGNFGVVLSKSLDDGLFVLSQLDRASPLPQALLDTALACALVHRHPGLAKWSIERGVNPDAMCEPEGTSLLGMMAHMDTSNDAPSWRALFPRLLAHSSRPQIVNPAIITDEVLLGQWLDHMPALSEPGKWADLDPQVRLDEVIVDACYLAPLPVLERLIEAGFPLNEGKAMFMALIRGNHLSAALLFRHCKDLSTLVEYRTEHEAETLLHAIAHREQAQSLVDHECKQVQCQDYLALLPVLLEIDPLAMGKYSGNTAADIAPPKSPLLGWIHAMRQAQALMRPWPAARPSVSSSRRI